MSRLDSCCRSAAEAGRKLLIPYLVAGDPSLEVTAALMRSLVEQGADIIELGIAFSDPASDGPVIQRAAERALTGGTTLAQTLDLVREFRKDDGKTPVVLMGYLNPIEIMGYEEFVRLATAAGVDGVLIVDMPPAESGELHQRLRAADIDTIYLVAPTTSPARAAAITAQCSGYLYYVSLKGVTGAALTDSDAVSERIAALKQQTELPIVVGFGIKDADSAAAMARLSDGVVVGSALVSRIAELAPDAAPDRARINATTALIGTLRKALNSI